MDCEYFTLKIEKEMKTQSQVFNVECRITAWGFRLVVILLGLEYEVRGLENIDRNEGGVMVVAPHQSGLDLAGR